MMNGTMYAAMAAMMIVGMAGMIAIFSRGMRERAARLRARYRTARKGRRP